MGSHTKILKELVAGNVDFILGGGVACVLHGVERVTMDVDVAVHMESANWDRLVRVMSKMGLLPRAPISPEALVERLERYQEYLKNPRICHTTYKKIVTSPEAAKIRMATTLRHLEGYKKIFSKQNLKIERENFLIHKSQAAPGDHIRKLHPDTIRHCNTKIRHLMRVYV
jgi:hypothetical protein